MNVLKTRLAVLIATLSLTLVACGGGSGPGAVYTDIMKNIEKGNIEEAMASIQIEGSAVSVMGSDKIKTMLVEVSKDISRRGGIKNIKILSEDIEGVSAEITAETTMGDGSVETDDINFTKIDGKWMMKLD